MDSKVDAVIVGAGPAGGMAARTLAGAGFQVALLERRPEVGATIQCGEGLSAAALELNGLPENEKWISHRVRGAKLHFPGGTWCFITRAKGYSVYRDRFDQWIVEGAVDRGAELRLGTAMRGMSRHNGGWEVRTNVGCLHAPIVIGADGPRSVIAETMGWVQERRWLNALEYRFPEEILDYGDSEYLHLHASSLFAGGYGWVFPRQGEYNVGVCSPLPLRQMLLHFCAELGVDGVAATRVIGGLIPRQFVLEHLAGAGVAVAGDAAGVANPISGGGIHPALISGRLAWEWAVRALEAEDPSLLDAYERELRASPYLDPVAWDAASTLSTMSDARLSLFGQRLHGESIGDLPRRALVDVLLRWPSALPHLGSYWRLWRGLRLAVSFGW